jgi:hypothetical protein
MTQSIAIAIGYAITQTAIGTPGLQLDRFKLQLDTGLELKEYFLRSWGSDSCPYTLPFAFYLYPSLSLA